MNKMHQQAIEETMQQLDETLDRVDELIMSLPLRTAVKHQLTKHIYTLYSEVESALDVTPVDWE